MAIDTAAAQALIQERIQSILIDPLFAQGSTFLSLGVRVFQTAAPISVPTITGHFSAGYIAEGAEIPVQDFDGIDAVSLLPTSMRSLKLVAGPITNESLRASSQALDSIIQGRLVADVATEVDKRAWSALGDGVTTPQGLLAWSGVQQFNAGTDFSPDDLLDMQALALASNIPPGNLRFVLNPANFSALRKLKDADGRYLVQPDLTKGTGFTLLGTPVVLTSHLAPTKTVLLDPQAIAVAVDVNPVITLLREVFALKDAVGIRVVARLDHKPVAPHSIIIGTKTA